MFVRRQRHALVTLIVALFPTLVLTAVSASPPSGGYTIAIGSVHPLHRDWVANHECALERRTSGDELEGWRRS